MRQISVLALVFLALFFVSCKKQSSTNNGHTVKTIYRKFIDSLDGLSQDERVAAINKFLAANPPSIISKSTMSGDKSGTQVTDDASYWAQLTDEQTYDSHYNPTVQVFYDYGPTYPYSDWYSNGYGGMTYITGWTKIMVWTMLHNYYNLWDLKSREQFVGGCNYYGPAPYCKFLGIKHKWTGLSGVTSFLSWTEKLADDQLSNLGSAAYSNIQGELKFNYKLFSLTQDINAVNFWTYDGVF